MTERHGIAQPSGLTVTSGGLRAAQEALDAKHRRVGIVPSSPFVIAASAVTSGGSFGGPQQPPSPLGMNSFTRPSTRARSKSRASSDEFLVDAETSATDTDFVQMTRSDDERSSGRDAGCAAAEPRMAPVQEALGCSGARCQLKRAISNEESGSGPSPEPTNAAAKLMRSLSEMEHTNAALEVKIGQAEEENRSLQVVLASTQQQWKDTLSVNARLLAEQQQQLELQRPSRATRANKRQRTMANQAEVTAATWRPQLSAASYPQSGSTITSSYPGSSQAMAGAPILHMACVLPRIDSGAAYPVCRLPTGHALAHGKPKQPPAAAAAAACKAGGASPQARSESANNTDIGGVSGGFFNEAEAAYFEAAMDAELTGLDDFAPGELGGFGGNPLDALFAGADDAMHLPDAWL